MASSSAGADKPESVYIRLAKAVNSFTELPFVYEVSWIVFYAGNLLIGPLYAGMLCAWWTIEGLTGKWWPRYNQPAPGQAVLITGCDSGFGHETAVRLARAGWSVYAGCLTDAGMAALAEKGKGPGASKLVPVKMDVTKPEDVERVVARLVADKVSLYALINNAGVGRGGPMDWVPMAEYRQTMEVNFFAVVSVTKACLPLLKQSQGRIINVSSIAGIAAAPLMSAYCASKHAVEAFSTATRVELASWGIKVVTLTPSFHKTPIATNALASFEKAFRGLSEAEREAYGDNYLKACAELTGQFTDGCWDPVHVVDKIIKATTLVDPMPSYAVGVDGRFQLIPFVLNTPLTFQVWALSNTYYRKLVPAAMRKGFKSTHGEDKSELQLPTTAPGTNGNGTGIAH